MTNEAAVDYVETMIAHSMDIPTPEDVSEASGSIMPKVHLSTGGFPLVQLRLVHDSR